LAAPGTESRAEILYRIGKLYMQAEDYGSAAAALVRAELAAGDAPELRDKIGPVMVDCLRRLGLYGEVGRELSRRVEAGADKAGQRKVLATIAGEELCEADLDRMIERRVDQMLGLQGVPGDEAARQMLLKRLSEPQTRQQLFQELLQRELFTRRARELKLDRDEGFQQTRRMLEEDLLAKSFQEREVGKIQPTDVDVQAYYQAHAEQYRQPESLTARLLPLQSGEEPVRLLEQIKSATDFQRLAAERTGPAGKDSPGTPPPAETLLRGREHEKLGSTDILFTLEAGKWTEQPVVHREQRWLVLVESKTPARTLPLEEVRAQVEAEYRAQKQQELARKLFQELVTRYRVQLSPPEPAPGEKKR
jgi:parvulin-like peptidyl-prolyl isomerase